jgi:hypothetical protein
MQPSFAACQFGYYPSGAGCRPDVFINAATVVMFIVFLFLAALYMIARSVESPRLVNWTETELYQALGTAMILAFYLGSVSILDNIIGPAFSGASFAYPGEVRQAGNFETVKSMASGYLNKLNNEISDMIEHISQTGLYIGMLGTFTIGLTVGGQSNFIPLLPGFGAMMGILSTMISIVSPFAMQLKMQQTILNAWDGLFGVLLPLGILLRAFPFTRTAGGALIAIAVGFTLLLPLIYLIMQDVAEHYWVTSGCANVSLKVATKVLDVGFTGMFGDLMGKIEDMFKPGGTMSCILFKLAIEATVLPFFGYLMVLNVTRYIAELLGANVDFSSLVRII